MAESTSQQDPADFSLVLGGPLYQVFRRTRLSGPALELLRRRIIFLVLLCWLPLAVLSLLEAHFFGGTTIPFFRDIFTHVRFLIALPILILAELLVHQRIRRIVAQFLERHIIRPEDLPRFLDAIDAAMRIRNSLVAEILLLIFALTGGVWIWFHQIAFLDVASWYASPRDGHLHLTLAGDWFAFVSVPIFQFILLRWYLRILIWFWFLLKVSRLNLHLLATHPDRAGGLAFVGRSSFAFSPLLFAQGIMLSGQIAGMIFYQNRSLMSFKMTILGFIVFFVLAVLGPMLLFTPQLARAKRQGLEEFGAFATEYVSDFDQKWLRRKSGSEELLGTGDIQSLADLGNSFAVVREMRVVPFVTDDLIRLVVATAVPLLPLLLTIMPLDQLLAQIFKMLF